MDRRKRKRILKNRIVCAYIALQVLVGALIIASCAVERWYKYCWWYFGLVYAENTDDYEDRFDDEDNIDDVDNDACNKYQHMVENSCDDFCGSVKKFQAGGILMILFSSLTLLNIGVLIIIHSIYLCRPSFRFKHVIWVSVLQPILYFGGFFSLLFYGQLYDLGTTHNRDGFPEPSDFKIELGLVLACVAAGLNCLPMIYSLLTTYRILRNNVV
mmetsp:Transcript_7337/g.13590  ORF Transcript_7337/g.13590 Transcript_7337/m.13590 type:complete len:214 (+) Transcript_7337:673-1314(+)